jgi:hypothetical protein
MLVISRLAAWLSTAVVHSTIADLDRIWPPYIERIAYLDLNPRNHAP